MQRRGGGGGASGAGVDARAARNFLLSLFDGAVAGSGTQRGRGAGGGRSVGRLGPGSRQRDGEWTCSCGFNTNRPARTACFHCGRPRDAAAVRDGAGSKGQGKRWAADGKGRKGGPPYDASGGLGKGPVGAGGSRPLLGWHGRNPLGGSAGGDQGKGLVREAPWNGKGSPASLGSKGGGAWTRDGPAAADGGKGAAKGAKGSDGKELRGPGGDQGRPTWARPRVVLDEEGYELVQPRRIRVAEGEPQSGTCTSAVVDGGGQGAWATATTTTRPRWSDEDDSDIDVDDGGEVGGDGGDDEGGDGGGDAQWEWEADPSQLRAAYEEHARAARDLERRGICGAALATLQQARDEAERKWRETKPPAPLPKRLEWADAKVRKAQAALTRVRLELDSFDEETDRKRAEICARVHVAQQWYQWRKKQLDDVHEEAAETAPRRRNGTTSGGNTEDIRKKIRGFMLPEMQAILEDVPTGSSLHERLSLFAAGLADAEAKLGAPPQGEEGPTCYHMGDDESCQGDWEQDYQGTARDEATQDDRTGGLGRDDKPVEWRADGPGRWSKKGAPRGEGQQQGPLAAATAAQNNAGGAAGESAAAGGGPEAATATGAAGGDDGDGGEGRAGKHRRRQSDTEATGQERAAADARRARELQQQLERAAAVQERSYRDGQGGFGSEAALSAAAQSFVLQVQKVQAQAGEMGVEPRAEDGRTLLQLSPAELDQWARDNLGDDAMHD